MAEVEDGNLIDLFDGLKDLKDGMVRTPLNPEITMMDDPLRILRALRFSITKEFTIGLKIWDAMAQPDILEKLKTTVSIERMREEIFKMMKHDTPKSLRLLHIVEESFIPGFLDLVFSKGMWLKPTNEK